MARRVVRKDRIVINAPLVAGLTVERLRYEFQKLLSRQLRCRTTERKVTVTLKSSTPQI